MGEIELQREKERKTEKERERVKERLSERKRVNEKNKKEGFVYRESDWTNSDKKVCVK